MLLRRGRQYGAPAIDGLAAPAIERATDASAQRRQRIGTEEHKSAGHECEKFHEPVPHHPIACLYRCRNRKSAFGYRSAASALADSCRGSTSDFAKTGHGLQATGKDLMASFPKP